MTQRPATHDRGSREGGRPGLLAGGPGEGAAAVRAGVLPRASEAAFGRLPTLARTL